QHRQPLPLVAAVVADDGQALDPAAGDLVDAMLGVPTQAEAAGHDAHAVLETGQGFAGAGADLVHDPIAVSRAAHSARPPASSSASLTTKGGARNTMFSRLCTCRCRARSSAATRFMRAGLAGPPPSLSSTAQSRPMPRTSPTKGRSRA